MKKPFTRLLASLLVCLLLCPLLLQRAEAASASLSGSSSLRAGNSVTVTFSVSGSGLLAVDANLKYDAGSLELVGTKQLIGGSWDMQQNGNKFILYDAKQNSPINSSKKVFSVTFRVKKSVEVGDTVSASVSGTASDGASESSFSASWSAKIKAPLSSDAKLTDLRCSNADLKFTGSTEYYITVPYSVSSLKLDWDRSHSGADVSVSGNKLSVGSNTVTITVTAEDGTVKRYYIYAKRQQDPNYVPSTDAYLKSLKVSVGTLSPAFDPEITEYVVYLANEIERLELSGTARDSKAENVRQVGTSNLPDEPHVMLMRCTAEDGKTIRDYKVHVIRMPAFTGTLPEIIAPEELVEPEPAPPAEPEPEPDPTLELPLLITLPYVGQVEIWWVAGVALFLLLLLVWLLAWAIGRRGGRKKALRQMNAQAAAVAPVSEEEAPTEEPVPEAPAAPVETPPEDAPTEEIPSEEPAAEEPAPEVQEELVEEAPVVEEPAPADVEPVEVAPAEEIPAEEIPAEPAPVVVPVADVPAEPVAPSEEAPAEEPAPVEEDPVFTEEQPFTHEDAPQPRSTPDRPSEVLEELGGISLDDLLEDIRNM